MDIDGYTNSEVAKITGKNVSTISNIIRLLKLPDEILDMLLKGELVEGQARALLVVEDKDNVRESNERYIEKYGRLDLETIYSNIQEITYNEAPYNSLYRGALSHDDLISFTRIVVDKFPVVKRKIADKYQLIFIDEYQDTSADVLHIFYEAMKIVVGKCICWETKCSRYTRHMMAVLKRSF